MGGAYANKSCYGKLDDHETDPNVEHHMVAMEISELTPQSLIVAVKH